MLNAEMKKDCKILLERALLDQHVACFGVDGCGQHGTSYHARIYKVSKIDVEVDTNEDGDSFGMTWITLENYHSSVHGHICTDRNFELSMNLLLKQQFIDPKCWTWCEVHFQEPTAVVLKIDVPKLLGWN